MGQVRRLPDAWAGARLDALEVGVDPVAPRTARRWLMDVAARAGVTGAANQVAELLVGEVVADAVLHAEPDGAVEVVLAGRDGRVRVTTRSCSAPIVPPELADPVVALLDALTPAWGSITDGDRREVWFELTREPAED